MIEIACWSWPVPPARDLDAELAAMTGELSASALRLVYGSAAVLRWAEFHAGARITSAEVAMRCAICGRPGTRPVDDHDHETGLLRGMLCSGCNTREGLGAFPEWADRNPATILGHRQYYVGGFGWRPGWWQDAAYARRLTGNSDWQPL